MNASDVIRWSEEEKAAIAELASLLDLTEAAVLRQALRSYQLAVYRRRAGETCTWSGDTERAREFAGVLAPPPPAEPYRDWPDAPGVWSREGLLYEANWNGRRWPGRPDKATAIEEHPLLVRRIGGVHDRDQWWCFPGKEDNDVIKPRGNWLPCTVTVPPPAEAEEKPERPHVFGDDWKLCYVDGSRAWFTTASLSDQWGDDWNDAPYEYNAGTPYEWRESCKCKPYHLLAVAFDGPFEQPRDGHTNSPHSVQEINKQGIPWLRTESWHSPYIAINPGESFKAFADKVRQARGKLFVPLDELTSLAAWENETGGGA